MTNSQDQAPRSIVPGSEREPIARATRIGPVDPSERATVTVVVAPRHSLDAGVRAMLANGPTAPAMDRASFAATYGAPPEHIAAVERFARSVGLEVVETDVARRSVVLAGTVGALQRAFGTELARYELGGTFFRGRVGPLSVPHDLASIVSGVFGLDDRPQARAQFRHARRAAPATAAQASFTPIEVARAYAFPPGLDGAGQTVAIVELGGGYTDADLATYFSGLGVARPNVASVGVDGATNAPTGDPNGADAEVVLDIEIVGAIAPGARIAVYFAPNTDRGFLDAITTAIHDTANAPSVLSISWGGPEPRWTAQALRNFDDAFAAAAMLGVTVFCASGDNGSGDGVGDGKNHVDFPSSSPHVVACGGTRLDFDGATIRSETAWNDGPNRGATGGGISVVFPRPDWQRAAGVPASGRGVPDVAGDADPQSGYVVRVDGAPTVIGGTSAVAPLYAALLARINGRNGRPAGFINPTLYANPTAFRDIVKGDNGAFSAGPGWDACTGLGSPDGTKLAAILSPTPP